MRVQGLQSPDPGAEAGPSACGIGTSRRSSMPERSPGLHVSRERSLAMATAAIMAAKDTHRDVGHDHHRIPRETCLPDRANGSSDRGRPAAFRKRASPGAGTTDRRSAGAAAAETLGRQAGHHGMQRHAAPRGASGPRLFWCESGFESLRAPAALAPTRDQAVSPVPLSGPGRDDRLGPNRAHHSRPLTSGKHAARRRRADGASLG